MKEIILTQGKVALIDDWNYEWLNQFKWRAHKDQKNGRWYAQRDVRSSDGKWRTLYMHRAVMGDPADLQIDHWNGDGLCNLEENLRAATKSQNMYNVGLTSRNKSGFKGVSWCKAAGKWRAEIYMNGKRIYLGLFDTALEAARAYNAASVKYHREFGFINPLPQEHQTATTVSKGTINL